jgi:hypothetical protein
MSPLPPHQERVIKERAELSEKVLKLKVFLMGTFLPTLPQPEQERLGKQYTHMKAYLDILDERIANF